MKDLKHYKKHVEVDMVKYSGNFHFNEQLRQEGTNIKINGKDIQIIDGKEKLIRAIVRNHGNEYNESKEERSVMIDKHYDYKVGDYVEYLGDTYLINSAIDKDNPFFNTTKMTRCNYILKWKTDGVEYEQPCIIYNNTKYTGGTKTQKEFTEVDAMVNITIQMNENTKNISYGKRFFTMKNAWRVTLIDDITTENVFSWTLGKDSINYETDDVVNQVCDAFIHKYTISLNSTSQSIVVGGTYQLNPIIKDDGKETSNSGITFKSSDETIATVDTKGLITALKTGSCIITCSIGEVKADLSLSVIAKATKPVINYTTSWTNNNGSVLRFMSSTTANFVKTVDGIEDNSLAINYSFDSIGQSLISQKKLTIIKINDRSFTIKNTNTTTLTNISVTFTDASDGTVVETKEIQIKGV